MPVLLSWLINLCFPGCVWSLLFLKKLQLNPGSLSKSQLNPSSSPSHYVWSNPSLLGLQSRTPAPCGWDWSGQEHVTSATTPLTTVCYLYSLTHSLAWKGVLWRLNYPQPLDTMSLEDIYKFLQSQVAQMQRKHELIPCGTLPRACHEQHLWVMWWDPDCNPECCKLDDYTITH